MNKPITVARQGFVEDLVLLINNSGLPAFIIDDVLKDARTEMQKIAQQQYASDLEAYNKELEKEKEKENEEKKKGPLKK